MPSFWQAQWRRLGSRAVRRRTAWLPVSAGLLFGCSAQQSPAPPEVAAAKPAAPTAQTEPALAKSSAPGSPPVVEQPKALPPELRKPWSYPLRVDHGIREDEGGQGGFLAPRTHGKHNGLDFLAPIGTELHAPCTGKAKSAVSSSFGIWVKVVCAVPAEIAGKRDAFASIFFSHLSKSAVREAEAVRQGQLLGKVGKSGNARGSDIAPHVHVEIAVHDTQAEALEERHSGRDHSKTRAAERFARALETQCLEPNGFGPRSHGLSRARRLDPFVVLACLSDDKPRLVDPPTNLISASVAWSKQYEARTFDVDRGRQP